MSIDARDELCIELDRWSEERRTAFLVARRRRFGCCPRPSERDHCRRGNRCTSRPGSHPGEDIRAAVDRGSVHFESHDPATWRPTRELRVIGQSQNGVRARSTCRGHFIRTWGCSSVDAAAVWRSVLSYSGPTVESDRLWPYAVPSADRLCRDKRLRRSFSGTRFHKASQCPLRFCRLGYTHIGVRCCGHPDNRRSIAEAPGGFH